jgi:CheY-like chemotaxis protein
VIQEITRQLLENVGIDVTLARNGLEALEQIEERTYDLVLMDVQMPVMDGLEAARRIRERKGGGGIPIVAMTANVFKENIRECLAAGMDDHLAKPIEPEKLYHTILKWLKQGRVTRPSAAAVLAESVKAEDPEELTSLEALEGLDVAVGIGLTGGRPQAYVKLLKKFLEQQQDTGELLRREAGEEDPSRLFQRIHSLKGTTGSLGMGHLYALCLESEASCTAEEESQACLEKVTELASSLDEMSGQLEKFLETGAFRKQAVILDDRELAVICNDLREKLVAYDTRAIDIFEGFKSRLGEMEGWTRDW